MEKIEDNDIEFILDSMIEENSNSYADSEECTLVVEENKIPDSLADETKQEIENPLITRRSDLNIGLTADDIIAMFSYISGAETKPAFLDKFTADIEGKLKDTVLMTNLLQLQSIPTIMALQANVRERLYCPENLYSMDIKDLTASSSNLSKEISSILSNATNSVQTFSQYGGINSEYRKLLDRLVLLPEDKLSQINNFLNSEIE